jgi:hypothetical protein
MRVKFLWLLPVLFLELTVRAQTSAFTYQGRLNNNSVPANGNYDICLQLVDASTNLVAGPVTNSPVGVTNGLFTITPAFPASVFNGNPLWLELGVRAFGQSTAYTVLSPLQPLTATPYAIHALTSADGLAALQATTNEVNTYYSNSIAPALAATLKVGGTNLPFITLSPHGIKDHCSTVPNCGMMFGIDTPGTLTGGLQEAVNLINASATNVSAPAGGKIEIGPGTVYTYDTVTLNGTNCTYVIEGAGLSSSGVLYMGTKSVPALYFCQATNFGSSSPQFFLRDLFVSATNDVESYLVECNIFGKIGIEDCWFGYYPFMAFGNGYNGSSTFGFAPPSYGGTSASYLIAIYLEGGSVDDIAWINNCDFSGVACGLINDCDHAVVDNNMFLFCGNNSRLPNTGSATFVDSIISLASLGVAIVQGHSTHENDRYHNNYFYGGNYAYAMDDDYSANAVLSDGDGFESMNGNLFISPQSRFTQMDQHGYVPGSVAITDSYFAGGQPYEPAYTSPAASIRTITLNADNASFSGYDSFNFGSASLNPASVSGNGSGLTSLNATQLAGTVPVANLPGITTNYAIAGGPTLYITNGVIMKIH